MKPISLLSLGLPILAYAETHYSFKGIYSRLKKNEPEILADVPFRIEPGVSLPVLILVKDAHLFPILLEKIHIEVSQASRVVIQKSIEINEPISTKFWHRIFPLAPAELSETVDINVAIEIKTNGEKRIYYNDNYRISSHAPFTTYIAQTPLPREQNFYWGDLHYHSAYTNDQVEFGGPLPATIELAKSMGLRFFAATEHSYDMDDHEDDYLRNDSNLKKWQVFRKEIKQLNQQQANFIIIPGEEVSAGNHKNQNIHFLIYNNPEYLPGKGDSAEKWFYNKPDLTIPQVLQQMQPQALAVASHPEVKPPWLQKLLIRRGKWELPDYAHSALAGLQVWNGRDDKYLAKGLEVWKNLLLRGRQLFIYAGNDAHGNFNRFRQIGFPFFTFREMKNEIFGYARTGVFCKPPLTPEKLLAQIRKGMCVISNGPLFVFQVIAESGKKFSIGELVESIRFKINVTARTTDEFGFISQLRLMIGDFNTGKETTWFQLGQTKKKELRILKDYDLEIKNGYLRGVLVTQKKGKRYYCYTNPLWFNLQEG